MGYGRDIVDARRWSLLTLLVVGAFLVFFELSKQVTAVEKLCPFGEDPFDATSSFGLQLGMLCASIALVRAFRAGGSDRLALRACVVALLSVGTSSIADLLGLLRYPGAWARDIRGWTLAACVLVLATLALGLWWQLTRQYIRFSYMMGGMGFPAGPLAWGLATLGLLGMLAYPPRWNANLAGELLSVVLGMGFLFGLVALLAFSRPLPVSGAPTDLLDDLSALLPPLRCWERHLRRGVWPLVVLLGLIGGGLLVVVEAMGEGFIAAADLPEVSALYVGCELMGAAVGFLLLGDYLYLVDSARQLT